VTNGTGAESIFCKPVRLTRLMNEAMNNAPISSLRAVPLLNDPLPLRVGEHHKGVKTWFRVFAFSLCFHSHERGIANHTDIVLGDCDLSVRLFKDVDSSPIEPYSSF
jgi:hypothetical protein